MTSVPSIVQVVVILTPHWRDMVLVYNLPCESDEKGHKHTHVEKQKFLLWFGRLGGQENNANVQSLSFQIYSEGRIAHGLNVWSRFKLRTRLST